MRKVIYGGGLFTFNDMANLPFPEKYVDLVEIEPEDEVKSRAKYREKAIKEGRLHPRKRLKAVAPKA